MRKWLMFTMLLAMAALYSRQATAERKENHKDYASSSLAECSSCHKGEGVAPNHDSDWVRGHRLVAQKPGRNCNDCHDQAFCLDCHTGGGIDTSPSNQTFRRDYKPKSHRSDFIEIHPIKAMDNPQSCTRCHSEQKFCIECHERFRSNDLQFQSHRRQFSAIQLSNVGPKHEGFSATQCQSCHPGGMLPTHKWSADHAVEARRNLQACQTCHNEGDVCMKCHSARTGLKVSPHPRNWDSVKGNYRDKSNGRSCVKCHDHF
ncbi:cytochrome C [Geobacter grbiciae]|uniref:cytochrome C n=1 Tax=Geobacter grbiciae TaxID=155042 RepID=UPI0031B80F08